MCTLVLLRRPDHAWPLLIAANRDELRSRPWHAPGRHWPDRPEVHAGRDLLSGGSWLGVNDHGLVAAVLNRVGTLGPAAGKRSRGELVLDALDHVEAGAAAEMLVQIDPDAFRPFNLVVADRRDVYWIRHGGAGGSMSSDGAASGPAQIQCHAIDAGLSMLTAREMNDPASSRIAHYLPRFRAAPPPDPEHDDWAAWTRLLAARESPDDDPRNAMTIATGNDYGTVCASLIALPREGQPRLWFAPGPPDQATFERTPL